MEPSSESLRLFIGLWPPAAVRDALLAHAQAWQWPARAKRTRTERLHLTLHFLGEVPAQRLPELRAGLDVAREPFAVELDQSVVWHGGIAVLEATMVPQALSELHARLAQRLQALGLSVEARRYRPHVTLARKAGGARPPVGAAPLHWSAPGDYALVRSVPGGGGYQTLQAFG